MPAVGLSLPVSCALQSPPPPCADTHTTPYRHEQPTMHTLTRHRQSKRAQAQTEKAQTSRCCLYTRVQGVALAPARRLANKAAGRQQTCSCRNACVSTSASSSGGMSNASPQAPKASAPTSASTSPFAPCAPCASATSVLLDALCCPLALGPSSPTSTQPAPRTAECVSALPPAARPGLELEKAGLL